jgi:serine/threonine protein kinase/Flp pilus assembly protein TadD
VAIKCPKCEFENPSNTCYCGRCGTRLDTSSELSVTKTLESTPEGFAKGKLFAGRFELIEESGAGGMGQVYRAYDKEVGEEIALKILHPEIALDERTVDRFRNEIKLARRITHKNVCRMHELHQDGKQLFITMEYVLGQDLKGLIKESGALATGKAISIAKQVAEGLAEAHDLGVVHRDLKPQNIMVDKQGVAKIMDFGIARSLRATGMTAEGMIIGTPEYMAPEQVEGLEADQRTDIYALGAILFEMVTGRVPFEGDSPLSVAYKHKNEIPIPPCEFNVDLPEPFNKLILRCLEKEKENRYQTADELLADLIRIEDGLPISERVILKARPAIRISREKPKGLKRFRVPAAIALALFIAAAVLFRTVFYKPSLAAPKIANSVAIISFTNLTGDKDLDVWTRGIPERLITSLENTGNFQVMTWERMHDIFKQMGKKDVEFVDSDLGFDLCRRAGVESLVTGTLTRAGDMFALDVRILDAASKKLRKSAGSKGEGISSLINTQVDELSRAIAEGLGISKEKIEQAQFQVAEMTTSSSEAYRYFVLGKERNEFLDADKAAEYLEKAVQIDPQFAIAYNELGWAYISIRNSDAMREAFKKAMELSGRASKKDRLEIEASYAWWVEGDWKKSTAISEEIVNRYPDDKWSQWTLGYYYFRQKRFADAVKVFQVCLRLDPNWGNALNQLAFTYALSGDLEKAVETIKKYIAVSPGEANPWDSLAYFYASMGKIDEAMASYKEALKIQPNFELAEINISYLFAFKEDWAEALESIERFLSLNRRGERRAGGYVWKALYLYWLGSPSKSSEALRLAEEASQSVGWRDKGAVFYMMFNLYYDKGKFETARQFAQRFVDHNIENDVQSKAFCISFGDFLNGRCDLKEGRVDSARKQLRDMKSLLQDVSGREKEALAENISDLQADINLAEGSVKEAVSYLEQNVPSQDFRISFQNLFGHLNLYPVIDYDWPTGRERLARTYKQKGDLDRAIAEYERLIAPDPKKTGALIYPRFYHSLGKLYEEKGLKDKARNYYRRFLDHWNDADPGTPEVEDAKDRLASLT